jgi:hypothetical protein
VTDRAGLWEGTGLRAQGAVTRTQVWNNLKISIFGYCLVANMKKKITLRRIFHRDAERIGKAGEIDHP